MFLVRVANKSSINVFVFLGEYLALSIYGSIFICGYLYFLGRYLHLHQTGLMAFNRNCFDSHAHFTQRAQQLFW